MFTRRKEELQILQKSLESLENSQKNTELMVSAFCQMMESEKKNAIGPEMSDDEKRRAAYALNLCTVSVSQIIDYNDENILEQEYETILNNLNLENMPKDEALLNILKQILDTVTFFRIQEGDKALIEKEYQHKMKNAIWSGIPNFGLIVAGGNLGTIALSLASQVGIGYMNYRKAKAENELEREQSEWQLQRAAIEQLNGLRRELFDASWRLADRYGFKDEYRLTERQITQYNKILMDIDDLRRHDRLEAIKDYFVAYPSFWYHFGHAANCIAQRAIHDQELDIYEEYREKAIRYFDRFLDSDKYALLREDQITSSCALEYIDLLDSNKDRGKIEELLERAEKMSGRACDILQICAIAHLKISDIAPAIEILKYLVNENYNAVANAQLLSSIYVSAIIDQKTTSYVVDYKILQKKISAELLFPYPEDQDSIDDLKEEFIRKQQEILCRKYAYVIKNYCEKYSIKFNKAIPVPVEDKQYPDFFFSDNMAERRKELLKQYRTLFSNKNKADEYLNRLANSNFALSYLETLNTMVNNIESIIPGEVSEKQDIIEKLVKIIKTKIDESKNVINDIQNKINNNFGFSDFEELFKFSFGFFTKESIIELSHIIEDHVSKLKNMAEFSEEETLLRNFCIEQGIPEFRSIVNSTSHEYDDPTGKNFFTGDLLGEEANDIQKIISLAREMEKKTNEKMQSILIPGEKKQKTHFYTKWNKSAKDGFKKYFRRKGYYRSNTEVFQKTFAVLVNESWGKMDLVFTTDGIICNKVFTGIFDDELDIIAYNEFDQEGEGLAFRKDIYVNKEVNMVELNKLIQDLAEMVAKANTDDDQVRSLPYNEVRMIEAADDIME